jgi:hypothetical protein
VHSVPLVVLGPIEASTAQRCRDELIVGVGRAELPPLATVVGVTLDQFTATAGWYLTNAMIRGT